MSNKELITAFWNCGDNDIIEFALQRARLNRHERETLAYILDDCLSQEETAEVMDYSVRAVQNFWQSAINKLLRIPWVTAYARDLGSDK